MNPLVNVQRQYIMQRIAGCCINDIFQILLMIIVAAAAVVHASMLDRGVTVTTESSEHRTITLSRMNFSG